VEDHIPAVDVDRNRGTVMPMFLMVELLALRLPMGLEARMGLLGRGVHRIRFLSRFGRRLKALSLSRRSHLIRRCLPLPIDTSRPKSLQKKPSLSRQVTKVNEIAMTSAIALEYAGTLTVRRVF
jgi:hypothetical protein